MSTTRPAPTVADTPERTPDTPGVLRPVRARPGRARAPWWLLLPSLLAAAVALLPLVYLGVRTGEAGGGRIVDVLLRPGTLDLVVRSLALTAAVTVGCLLLGIGLAALVTRTDLPGRRVFAILFALPLAVPSYVAAFAWVAAVPWARGFLGATVVLIACTYPYVYLPCVAAIRALDPAQEEVARSLGRSGWHTLWSITARQVRPAAASGALLVALYTLSDFGAVSLLQYDVFTRVIYTSYQASFDRTPAAVLSVLLVLITVVIALGERFTRRAVEHARVGSGVARRREREPLGAWRWPALAGAAAVAGVALLFPVASMTYWFVTGLSAGLDVSRLASSAWSTLTLAVLGGLLTMALAVPVGILAARYRGRTATGLELATWAGHALPGIVVALSLVFFGVQVARPIYQQTPLLLLAYAVLFLPAGVGAVRSAVALSSAGVEEVARSLGDPPLRVLRRVTLPIAAPGVAAGSALVMLTIMKELPATLLLHPTGTTTLATSLWTHTSVAAYGAAAPYALTLVVVAVLPTLWLMAAQGRLLRQDRDDRD